MSATDVKYKDIESLAIGYSAAECETITEVIRLSDKLVSPDGELVQPFSAINDKVPPDVTHHHRYMLVEVVTDGFNKEAFFDQQVQTAEATSRVIRLAEYNDFIEHFVAKLVKGDGTGGIKTVTYESGKVILNRLHIHVTNRKGTKYHPVTTQFKVRGEKVVT